MNEKPRLATAIVTSIAETSHGTTLRLRTHTGDTMDLRLSVRPDYTLAWDEVAAVDRAMSVIIQYRHGRCFFLGTTRRGPLRLTTTLGAGLALCASGVHTVVDFRALDSM